MNKSLICNVLLFMMIMMTGCMDSKDVKMVKNGELRACDGVTVDEVTKSYLKSPKWESGKGKDGVKFVNVSGGTAFQEKNVIAKIQFEISNDGFKYRAFEMNGVPQSDFVAIVLMQRMCESAVEKYLEFDRAAESDVRHAQTNIFEYYADNGKYPEKIDQTTFKASNGVRCDYKKIDDSKFTMTAYHDKGSRKYTVDENISGVKKEKR